jgi:diaminohydroxyphosphoribosylaminopyrimidine deaminase/5-amino-6-(5-phosphoribosylamino)uracil reductase
MPQRRAFDEAMMRRALELARRGLGRVEPNPPVGAVVVDDQDRVVGEGWHQQFGGPHAEVHALAAAGEAARGATLYVTLEPCCHYGKTPPCTRAVIDAGIRRVIIGTADPASHGTGRGVDKLTEAGLDVEIGVVSDDARQLIAPFSRLMTAGLPWIHAKWAMTLDGKIATRTGSSKWISNPQSRAVVHELRGRMDAIVTGLGTVIADDPLLTARPPGPRTATRVVLDSQCRIPIDCQLVQTARDIPLIVATTASAPRDRIDQLRHGGVEVLVLGTSDSPQPTLQTLAQELGRRRMTHVLFEAGPRVLGSLFDQRLVNEVHAFVAPLLVGGETAPTPIAGTGLEQMSDALRLAGSEIRTLDGDVYVHGRLDPA